MPRLTLAAAILTALLGARALAAQPGSPPAPSTGDTPPPNTGDTPPPNTGADSDLDPRVLEAREAFRLGARLAREERWDEARIAFLRSNAAKPHPVTLYDIGYCDRAMGRPARALRSFQQALDEHQLGQSGKLPDELVTAAQQHLAEALARVARVSVSGLESGRLSIDGQSLEALSVRGERLYVLSDDAAERGTSAGPFGSASSELLVLIDPGTHVFVAVRGGQAGAVQTRSVAAGEQLSLRFDAAAPPPPPPSESPARSPAPRRAAPHGAPLHVDRRLSYAAFGLGAVGLAVGSVAGLMAMSKDSSLAAKCGARGDECQPRNAAEIDSLHTTATVSTIGFVVAGVGVASGLVLYALSPKRAPAERRALALGLGPGGLWLRGQLPH